MQTSRLLGIARFLGHLALGVLAAAALGGLLPALPLLAELGPVLISSWGPWVTILALIGTVLQIRRWRTARTGRALLMAALAAFATIGTAFIQARQIGVARANGVSIALAQAFLPRSQQDDSLPLQSSVYGKFDGADMPLDVYRPARRAGSAAAPVIVYIHGGGWGGQTLKQRQADYRWFVERGYLLIAVEYTLSSEQRQTWNVVQPELGCALAWIGSHLAQFEGDPSRIALWGESAGGNLVLNVSYMANSGTLQPSCTGAVPRIAATIALYPVVDVARMYHNDDVVAGRFGKLMSERYTGGSPEQYPDRYAVVNSATHISAAAPPTLLIVPEADHLVAPDAAYEFNAQVQAAGVATRLIRMPYAEHAFDLTSGSIGNQLVRQSTLRFLEEHGLKP
jgi:acetyl esterase/lipase